MFNLGSHTYVGESQPVCIIGLSSFGWIPSLVPCFWIKFHKALDYTEIRETRRALKLHYDTLERNDILLDDLRGMLGVEGVTSNPNN
jgi:hypothetical protein